MDRKNEKNKEAFFLRHTACLPSSTSQLVLFHHLFCIHFWGGPLLCSLLGGSTSMFTSRGDPLPCSILGGPLLCTLLGGSHVTHPIMLLHTAIECPSASQKGRMGPLPQSWTDKQTNMTENITFLHTTYAGSKYWYVAVVIAFGLLNIHIFGSLGYLQRNTFGLLHWKSGGSMIS